MKRQHKSILRIESVWICMVFVTMNILHHTMGNCMIRVPNEGPLRFTENMTSIDYARTGEYREILCCIAGYDILLWYHWINAELELFPWYGDCPYCEKYPSLSDNNKTLQIKSVGENDQGLYMCKAINLTTGQTISHNMTLRYFSCSPRNGPPLAIPPSEPTDVNIGETITLSCKADYGCDSDDDGVVNWFEGDFQPIDNKRYNVTLFESENETIKGANLTIANVQEEDFSVSFLCIIGTDIEGKQQQYRRQLKKKVTDNSLIVSVSIPSTFVGVTILTGVIAYCFFKYQLTFVIKSRLCRFKIPDKGDKKYHTFIFNADENDNGLVDLYSQELRKRHYDVSSYEDVNPGQGRIYGTEQIMTESFSIIIIIPNHERWDDIDENHLLHVIDKSKSVFKPAYITLLLHSSKKAFAKNNDLCDILTGSLTIKIPGNDAMRWKKREFYSSLQNRLPMPNDIKLSLRHGKNSQDESLLLLNSPSTTPDPSVNSVCTGLEILNNDHDVDTQIINTKNDKRKQQG